MATGGASSDGAGIGFAACFYTNDDFGQTEVCVYPYAWQVGPIVSGQTCGAYTENSNIYTAKVSFYLSPTAVGLSGYNAEQENCPNGDVRSSSFTPRFFNDPTHYAWLENPRGSPNVCSETGCNVAPCCLSFLLIEAGLGIGSTGNSCGGIWGDPTLYTT